MPAFNTKTIETILEPVAQQVSKLVILQEEADDGNLSMPDLSLLVQVVKTAADNLIKVGYETCETSEDALLKSEMPVALKQVEEACDALIEASSILKSQSRSHAGKRKLIVGERGILKGVSDIVLAFDQSEVRKIIHLCKKVLEYLSITELIECMDDLVTYVKNLTPILTKMTREIDAREKELTNQIHRSQLVQHLEQVKNLTPSFISSMKIYLLAVKHGSSNGDDERKRSLLVNSVEQSKNFLIKRLNDEINEMIRILQLTAYDEDKLFGNNNTEKMTNFEIRLQNAFEWLTSSSSENEPNNLGEKSLRNALEDAILLIQNIAESEENRKNNTKATLINSVNYIKTRVDELCMLNKRRKSNNSSSSSNCLKLVNEISDSLVNLHANLKKHVNNNNSSSSSSSSNMKSNHANIFQIINKMCANPLTASHLGVQSAQLVIEEGRHLALQLNYDANVRDDFLHACYECEFLLNKLLATNDDEQRRQFVAMELREKMNALGVKISKSLIEQVADSFLDINYPLRKLVQLAISPIDHNNNNNNNNLEILEQQFNEVAYEFILHTQRLCNAAQQLINSVVQPCDKDTVNQINELACRILELTPQVKNAAYIVLSYPDGGNKATCMEHLELMQNEWQSNMQRLQRLVDDNVDCGAFIRACECSIHRLTFATQQAAHEHNHTLVIANALSIARRSNRIIQVANQEAENSEEASYVERILLANETMKQALPLMIQRAKQLTTADNSDNNLVQWTNANENLLQAIENVKQAVTSNDATLLDEMSNSSQASSPEIFNCNSSGGGGGGLYDLNSKIMPNQSHKPSYHPSRPTPLPDLVEENETELPDPQANEPILMAAHDLHLNVNQWYSRDNNMVAVAKNITHLMAKLSALMQQEDANCSKKELIATARQLADDSMEIRRIAILLANDCTDKRMKMNLLHVSDRIPTIGTQLKILSTVKATMLGSQMSKEDEEATEMLIGNANNLNMSVKATIKAAKSASIKIRTDSGMKLRWIRKSGFLLKKSNANN